ncbi:MAG: UDP-2,3-diacylglucosamine diphosphatase, partial [Bacteroidales bacterium]
ITMRTHIYFISDLHLGLPVGDAAKREQKVIRWLESVRCTAKSIYLLGDIFDFWWEYKYVVPRGYVRFLGKLAELTDSGIQIHYLTGNHDIWVRDYLSTECGVQVYHKPQQVELENKRFFLAHGDGLGNPSIKYRIMKWIFTNRFLQILYGSLHPWLAIGFGQAWSKRSRLSKGVAISFKGEENEHLFQFAKTELANQPIDFFVFGHRHTPMLLPVNNSKAQLAILSDWIQDSTYGKFDGNHFTLHRFE